MLNLNVGVLGHVDCGKTTIAKELSEISSTAAFDKNQQSQERGITLDLGFSSFTITVPVHLRNILPEDDSFIQFTLVDCPGHASLIRTIIGGAQIIDMMLLVIDATKGIQTQTAECFIIGELTCKKMIVVVNKIDLLQPDKEKAIEKITKKIKAKLSTTIFKESPFVFIAAKPGAADDSAPIGIEDLVQAISNFAFLPNRDVTAANDFVFAVDHCFGIKGQGTVMTGTILQGSIQINDNVHMPSLKLYKKIKSMQMFHKPISRAVQGDRIGICVTQFDPKLFERGIVCSADSNCQVTLSNAVIIRANKIKYFNLPIKSKSKFHITVGYDTNMATITCFFISKALIKENNDEFNFNLEYKFCEEFYEPVDKQSDQIQNFMLLEFDKPVLTFPNNLLIGSKLDLSNQQSNKCRLAFSGTLLATTKDKNYKNSFLPLLKIFKTKQKIGIIERMLNKTEVIVKNMFKKTEQIYVQQFIGLQVSLSTGESGKIVGQFGQSGKIKVCIVNGLSEEASNLLQKDTVANKKNNTNMENIEPVKVILEFKRYVYDIHKKIIQ